MNEKIKELADQSTEVSEPLSGNLCPDTPDLAKFAELIVRECAKVADKGWADPGHQIKQHFGVEE
jgi:hypothetical protein